MHVEEADSLELKKWVVKGLEDISDADSDVLADYVLALVKSEDDEDVVKRGCVENLEDFLHEHTVKFVNELFSAISTKSFLPGYVPPHSVTSAVPQFTSAASSTSNSGTTPFNPYGKPKQHNGNGRVEQSRKRSWNDHVGNEAHGQQYNPSASGERDNKQIRRGGSFGRGGRTEHPSSFAGNSRGPEVPGLPSDLSSLLPMPVPIPMPGGFPSLDPNNPLSAIIAMQAMGLPPLPGFPNLPGAGSPIQSTSPAGFSPVADRRGAGPFAQTAGRIKERCQDYDTKGFCAAGSMCPYDHGNDHIVVPASSPDEYDPKNASLATSPTTSPIGMNGHYLPPASFPDHFRSNNRSGFRGRGNHDRQRGGRAPFSFAGPNQDRSITSIVVEQIPEENFSEEAVRDFFSQFGAIKEVSMQAYKRLAVVTFHDYSSAQKAYQSPKVVFDNRFVKVYWYKPDAVLPTTLNGASKKGNTKPEGGGVATWQTNDDEDMVDVEEFAKKQAEAQRQHEEKMKKLKEAQEAKEDLDKKIKAQAEERKRLLEKLAAKTKTNGANGSADHVQKSAATTAAGTPSAQTEALRAKLAELEAEAETLGINSEEAFPSPPYPTFGHGGHAPRGRGYDPSYRGRSTYPPRGRGYDPSYRGRGRGAFASLGAGPSRKLDNRPKGVAVTLVDNEKGFEDDAVDEALRQHLFGIGDFTSITPADGSATAADSKKTIVVSFRERYVAENFIASAANGEITGLGKVELKWVPAVPEMPRNSTASPAGVASSGKDTNGGPLAGKDQDVPMSDGDGKGDGKVDGQGHAGEVDYDVADEDEDRWIR